MPSCGLRKLTNAWGNEQRNEQRSGTLRPRFLGSAALTSVVALISSTSTYFRRRVEYGTCTLSAPVDETITRRNDK